MALSYIRKLYRVESNIADKTDEERLKARQEISVPILNEFKQWLEKNAGKVMKGGALRKAIDYTLNQWSYLIGYCERGDLMIRISWPKTPSAPLPLAVKTGCSLTHAKAHKPVLLVTH